MELELDCELPFTYAGLATIFLQVQPWHRGTVPADFTADFTDVGTPTACMLLPLCGAVYTVVAYKPHVSEYGEAMEYMVEALLPDGKKYAFALDPSGVEIMGEL